MKPLFDLDEIATSSSISPGDRSTILRDNFLFQHERKVKTLKELCGRVPAPGEFFALWTLKSFNAFTFIPFLIHEYGSIDLLCLSTYTINRRIIDSLMKKIDHGTIKTVELFISDSLKHRMPAAVDHLQLLCLARPDVQITVNYGWNHSKITLLMAGDNYFVVEGSGNFGENAQYEQYLFFNDRKLFNFRMSCILESVGKTITS
jgi:hypothetical protein